MYVCMYVRNHSLLTVTALLLLAQEESSCIVAVELIGVWQLKLQAVIRDLVLGLVDR